VLGRKCSVCKYARLYTQTAVIAVKTKMEDLINKIKSSYILSSKAGEYVVFFTKEETVSEGEVLSCQGRALVKKNETKLIW